MPARPQMGGEFMPTTYCIDRQLKPCPFCGGEARLAARETNKGIMGFVACSYCKAQGQVFNVQDFDGYDDDFSDVGFANAVRAWQRRDHDHGRGEQ